MYHRVSFSGEVTLSFRKLTTKEFCSIMELDLGEMKDKICYGDLVVPKIDREWRRDCDGWEEPLENSWSIVYSISSCGGIDKDSLVKWYSKSFAEDLDTAEEIARYIEEKTGIKPEES